MQIVTPEQMKNIENRSESLGVSKAELMENAGAALAELIDRHCREDSTSMPENKSIVFLAGSGNNGGDCYAAANRLVYRGYRVTVINLCGEPQTELAKNQFSKLPENHITIINAYKPGNVKAAIEAAEISFMTLPAENDLSRLSGTTPLEQIQKDEKQRVERVFETLSTADVIADGVFGTGFHGQLNDELTAFFKAGKNAFRIAVDIPSGGNCATGQVSDGTFEADVTIAFGALKTGMTQYPLKDYCGKIQTADIGIPDEAYAIPTDERSYTLLDAESLAGFPEPRRPDAHKGDFGRVLCITGSSEMRGAAALSVLGALRSGAGLVRAASCPDCINTVSVLAPEATFIPLECDDNGFMLFDCNRQRIESELKKADAVLIGCGLGVTPDTVELTRFVTENAICPIIIDADGLNCIASDIDILQRRKAEVIITPHPGEMARLIGKEGADINKIRFFAAEKLAEKFHAVVVLKGAGTVIADNHFTSVCSTGNPGMSKGGSGDVLAGMIASLAAQGYSCFDAARFGAYIHGLAGNVAAEKLGHEAMLPRDIIDSLSDSFRIIKEYK